MNHAQADRQPDASALARHWPMPSQIRYRAPTVLTMVKAVLEASSSEPTPATEATTRIRKKTPS